MSKKLICLSFLMSLLGFSTGLVYGQSVNINFQPRISILPEGYLPDYGEVFADRGNGFSYGWDMDIQGDSRERGQSFDQRYDTLVQMQEGDPRTWEIELTNGGYDVFLACGDPSYNDQINTIDVEGNILTDPDGRDNFDEYNVSVIVSDGRLTIKPAPGGTKCKVMFLHINRIVMYKAYDPVPDDGSIHPEAWVDLSWTAGDHAVSHDVYFGENFDDVSRGAGDTFQGNHTDTNFIVGTEGNPYPDGLVPGTTYYWRVDEVNDLHPDSPWQGDVWSFMVPVMTAYDPEPSDGAEFVYPDVTLSWTAGFGAQSHTVYISDDFNDVNIASGGTLQEATAYTPNPLAKDTVYYWRVDEFDGVNTHTGDIWSFTTIPDIPITDPNLLCWWKFDDVFGDTVIDYSGYDRFGTVHGATLELVGRVGSALYFGGDGDYVVDEDAEDYLNGLNAISVCVWVKADETGTDRGFINAEEPNGGDNVVTIRYDRAGASFGGTNVIKMAITSTPLWVQQLETSSNVQSTDWQHVTMTWVGGGKIKCFIDGVENAPLGSEDPNEAGVISGCTKLIVGKGGKDQGTTAGWKGFIDGVRIYNIELDAEGITQVMRGESDLAWNPSPANGSVADISIVLPLSWSAGENAVEHDVYFGTDMGAVANSDTSDTTGVYRGRQNATSYTPPEGVEWGGGPYYWRVDEYNTDATITKGRLWRFTVADFILVDDFEDYNIDDNQIWHAWKDGLGYAAWDDLPAYPGNNTGSSVGDETTYSYTEETIVHSGDQSMPYHYYNNKEGSLKYSEAQKSLSYPRDWTERDVNTLSLWFRGYSAGFKEEPEGTYIVSASGIDISGASDEFRYVYLRLSGPGSITARVLSVENTDPWAKAGVMIRRTLEPSAPFAAVYITPENGCRFQGRLAVSADVSSDTSVATPEQRAITAPSWVRLERDSANNFNGYFSDDGVSWQAMAWNPQFISMPTDVYIGLALTSHNVNAVCKAEFSDIQVTGGVNPAMLWRHEAIGTTMLTNDPEPMYVAIANSGSPGAVVYHDDPSAAQIDVWTRWDINLEEFANQGVDLTHVDSIAIGFGNRDNPQAGGSGIVYFDDIRLYISPEVELAP